MFLLRTPRARSRHWVLITALCALGCTDDLDLSDYPASACFQTPSGEDSISQASVAADYVDEHGHRVVKGDVMLPGHSSATGLDKSSISVSARPWPAGIVAYTVDSTVPDQTRDSLEKAIAEFENHTNLRFVRRTTQNASTYSNYVRVTLVESEYIAGRSSVGMVGGEQDLELTIGATLTTTLHEVGHAVGLLHEQQRHDRDRYVTVHEENIDPDNVEWFRDIDADGMDVGDYDFNSVMHYSLYNARAQWNLEPNVELWGPCWIGGAQRLSPGDLAGISMLYPDPNLAKHCDLNGDRARDHILRFQDGAAVVMSPGSEQQASWREITPSATLDWYLTGTGDFVGDGMDDLLWTLPDGSLRVFDMGKGALDATALVGSRYTSMEGFQVAAIDDFDGNGKHELLTMSQEGRLAIVIPETNEATELASFPGWRVAATGDLDGDARAEIVWSLSRGQTAVSSTPGRGVITKSEPLSHDPGWWIAGIDDFDGDGRNDVVWTSALGGVAMWWNDGGLLTLPETRRLRSSYPFAIAGTGDFDGDGVADLRWIDDRGAVGLELFSAIRRGAGRMVDVPAARFSDGRLLN